MTDILHGLICPIRARWRRRRYCQPFWRDDKVAKMLGIAHLGCPRCGRKWARHPKGRDRG